MFTHTKLLKCLGLQNISHINGLVFILQKPNILTFIIFTTLEKFITLRRYVIPK